MKIRGDGAALQQELDRLKELEAAATPVGFISSIKIGPALKDFALLIGMENDLPPTTALGHKRLEMLIIGECALRELQTALEVLNGSA